MISYKYKLYTNNCEHIDGTFREACATWNHALALQKRYYKMYGKYISVYRMKLHFTKMWTRYHIGSQSLQDILERLDKAYQAFFKHVVKRPPKFKKHKQQKSFTYKQCGYKFTGGNHVTLTLDGVRYHFKYANSRQFTGKVKTVTIKRNPLGEYFMVVVTDSQHGAHRETRKGASVGADFGLKTYLTLSDGTRIQSPQYFKKSLKKLKKLSSAYSRAKDGSNNKEKARLALARQHEKVKNQRNDFQWKLAHQLCRQYSVICLETLSLTGMTKLWGRKMHDLAHYAFVQKLEYVATKYGVTVHHIDKWFASSKLCDCGYKNTHLALNDREWVCPACGQIHDRDLHAAQMILRQGIVELEECG